MKQAEVPISVNRQEFCRFTLICPQTVEVGQRRDLRLQHFRCLDQNNAAGIDLWFPENRRVGRCQGRIEREIAAPSGRAFARAWGLLLPAPRSALCNPPHSRHCGAAIPRPGPMPSDLRHDRNPPRIASRRDRGAWSTSLSAHAERMPANIHAKAEVRNPIVSQRVMPQRHHRPLSDGCREAIRGSLVR